MSEAKITPFEKHAAVYEEWFEKYRFVYESELKAIKQHLPRKGEGIEVGVGSGRFASALGIKLGIDPSGRMREIARSKGITAAEGVAERLPFDDGRFGFVLMVTTICFLDDVVSAFREALRVIEPGGCLVIGFIDRDSPVGRSYQRHKKESKFYSVATFYSVDEVKSFLTEAGFTIVGISQTIFQNLHQIVKLEPIKQGFGEGSFVVIKASKPTTA